MNTAPTTCPTGRPPVGLDLRAYEVAAYPRRSRVAAWLAVFSAGAVCSLLITALTIVAFSVHR